MTENKDVTEQQTTKVKMEVGTRPIASGNNPNLLGFAKVKIGDLMVIKNVQIVQGEKGPFISMPSVKGKDGKYNQVCFPAKTFREEFDKAVLTTFSPTQEAYQKFNADAQRAHFDISINRYDKDNIRGFANLRIPGVMHFNSITVRENDKGYLWSSMPGYSYQNKAGEKAYHSFFEPLRNVESLVHGTIVREFQNEMNREAEQEFKKQISEHSKEQLEKESVQQLVQKLPVVDNSPRTKIEEMKVLAQEIPTRANEGIDL